MKLLIVTCLRDYKDAVANIFHEAGVRVFSMSDTTGVKDEHDQNLLDDWFGNRDGEFDSLILFSFTNADTSAKALSLIKEYNVANGDAFPIRAFILPVEAASYES